MREQLAKLNFQEKENADVARKVIEKWKKIEGIQLLLWKWFLRRKYVIFFFFLLVKSWKRELLPVYQKRKRHGTNEGKQIICEDERW